ncbi:hypothetical protein [Bradyrhizobium sp. STM 3562]|uniref:hypothetical protein n=1 Tax=Bradyrhizobium sp. STM 3562 TaxID=578924 RepID=UPI00388F942E
MKLVVLLAIAALLGLTLASTTVPSYAAAPGAMSGKGDWATRGYNQAAKEKQMKSTKAKKQQ